MLNTLKAPKVGLEYLRENSDLIFETPPQRNNPSEIKNLIGLGTKSARKIEEIFTKAELQQALIREFDLINNPQIERLDLGRNVPVFDWYIAIDKLTIKHNHLKYLQTKLCQFGRFYATSYPEEVVRYLLNQLAQDISSRFVGVGKSEINFDLVVEGVMKCIDTYELIRNKTIRFITNPYFEGKRTSSNSQLGKEKRESTSTLLKEYLADYDYNQGKITYGKISQDLSLSERTVKRYLKDRHLREIYDIVKAKSKR